MADFFGSIIDTIADVGGDLFDSVEKGLTDLSFKDIVGAGAATFSGGGSESDKASNPYAQQLKSAQSDASKLPASTRAKLQQSTPAKPVASVDPRDYYREWTTRLRDIAYQVEQTGK
jgi:hypothetical protein